MTTAPTLSIDSLCVDYRTEEGTFRALQDVSLHASSGQILGLVGESGCGKSTLGRSLIRLNDERAASYRGTIRLGDIDVLSLGEKELSNIRGSHIAMIFQDPLRSLNPVYTIGTQLRNALKLGGSAGRRATRREAILLLEKVGLDHAEHRLAQYPHQLSGGQRQRVVIAIALAQNPKVLIADEPTTALDVTTQKQILALLRDLCQDLGMTLVFITHDLAVVWQLCDYVAVMYYGIVVERGTVDEMFDDPRHPYTRGLLAAVPGLNTPPNLPLETILSRDEVHQLSPPWDDASVPLVKLSETHFVRQLDHAQGPTTAERA